MQIRHRRDYDKQKAVVVVQASLIPETHEYANVANASQRFMYLCSSAVYNQRQLTLIFSTISSGLQPKAANN